jgi:hypothetical protein
VPPLMPGTQNTDYTLLIAFVVVFILIVLCVFAWKHRRLRKPLAVAVIVTIVVVGVAYVFWSNEASIDYWLMTERDYPVGDNHLDVTCENVGHLAGTINLKLQFTNAQFINTTSSSYRQIDAQTATFTFTLQPGETQSSRIYFTVGASITDFYISLTGESGLFEKNGGGVSQISYQRSNDIFVQRIQTAVP